MWFTVVLVLIATLTLIMGSLRDCQVTGYLLVEL
jgi:hypothetical protein